ncbi:peptidylprolyl isomerase [Prochlorococcus marinus]|uniref:peptidylprolyl isomerase n=1 Tax=Prochlorococcus marinus TaxID=1219 RepID=UPI001ADBC00C|nr:peptidylprolyl isomerase [Prochlorococcus marinus]MBO8216989.1 peptidylprolyl isomerase [Prochlorococcus marinus XMU1405]MBW3040222.1 peptidylprolyl isomerase [Prochlorococcus marinus str. MU1405]MBW3047680.1 peptidylprolyl isomerase [Prochlorococcus marinus str. MU1406]
MNEISKQKLLSWGLLKQVYREEIIDQNIKDIQIPSDFKMEPIVEKWLINYGIKSNDLLQIWMKDKGFNNEQWKKFVLRDYKWRRWCREKFDNELPSYYLKRKPLLDRVTYSLIRVKDEDLAFELFMRINEEEEEFSDLSSRYSEGPEAKSGGKIGPVTLKQTHPVLAKILLISEECQLWPPKKIDNWWIIVRLDKLINTELNEEIALYLTYEMGEQFLKKETSFSVEEINLINKNNQLK